MWLVCILSLALCLHFNTHANESGQLGTYTLEVMHSHHHEISQPHKHVHQDSVYEHFVGYDSVTSNNLENLLTGVFSLYSTKKYVLLIVSRIFKPPKITMNF